ncbi:hypothetical protein [Natronorubrum texcoconense]|uniref:Uncharacterized protein n=1 Tax=Natronorubrum texcoconense TaxID=1095776 RepID=A0A1G8TFU6_9EURY|nr:hypothetical protein [Natronorubrum texcoconense]SDJ40426.1 hypothetical protein SAMN04515672_0454 [Natronorubrum texcoconense]
MTPVIGTVGTIILSAFSGAAALMLLRILLKRRRLMAALHEELLNIHVKCRVFSEDGGHALEDALVRAPTTEFDRSAFQSLKTKDPALYVKITRYSSDLSKSYGTLTGLEYVEKDGLLPYKKYNLNDQDEYEKLKEEFDGMKGFVNGIISEVEESSKNSITEIENYTQESLIRRVIYWGCFRSINIDPDNPE